MWIHEEEKMSVIDLVSIIVDYCKVVEKQLRILLGCQIPGSMHTLEKIIDVISSNYIHFYDSYMTDLWVINELRRRVHI